MYMTYDRKTVRSNQDSSSQIPKNRTSYTLQHRENELLIEKTSQPTVYTSSISRSPKNKCPISKDHVSIFKTCSRKDLAGNFYIKNKYVKLLNIISHKLLSSCNKEGNKTQLPPGIFWKMGTKITLASNSHNTSKREASSSFI